MSGRGSAPDERVGPGLDAGAPVEGRGRGPRDDAPRTERLGIVSFTNVAPLHWRLAPWDEDGHRAEFVRGVPSELNRALLAGEIDLTLISSIEFLRHRDRLVALPDFSIATLGPVYSVTLFHRRPWRELHGASIAVTTDSSTSVELLRALLREDGIEAELVPRPSDLDAMLAEHDAALLIGDAALVEGVARREVDGEAPAMTDLGEAWYRRTRLPFTFAVWASPEGRRPSDRLVAKLRAARQNGLGHLADVSADAAARVGVSPQVMLRYLANFRYHLGPPDRDGLATFGRMTLPDFREDELRYWDG
jgi:chorismate dehydratase